MEFKEYVIKNRLTGEYWVYWGATTPEKTKATRFNEQQVLRFFRKAKHPQKWTKEEIKI